MRFGAAGIALVAGMLVMLLMRREPPHQVSLAMFVCISALMNLHCLLVGVRTTADCLSAEKCDGTLGLLFLTNLSARAIVFAKGAAAGLLALTLWLASVPAMTLPVLMGGVPRGTA